MLSWWVAALNLVAWVSIATGTSVNYLETGYGNNHFGTKTGYFWTYPKSTPVVDSLMRTTLDGKTCNAVHVNLVSRHAARYTSVSDMRKFSSLKQKLEGTFTNRSFDFINSWVNTYPEDEAELVTPLGQKEMFYIGNKFGQEFRSLLSGTVDASGGLNSVRFMATRKPRTQESADWFLRGLSDVLIGQNISNLKPEVNDSVLRFYDHCLKYDQQTSNMTELDKFENGTEFQTMIQQIKTVMGTNVTLTIADVKMMYRLCATELAVMNNADWCKLQTDEHRDILEYDNDIEDYISRLYGYKVTQEMTCPLVQNVFSAMDDAIKAQNGSSSYFKGVFQFGHSDTIVDFSGALGLFKDSEPIRSDNYATMQNRKFRSSRVDPFSTHLAFILYNCGNSEADNYAIRLQYDGKPLVIPVCGSDICWYNDVRQYYSQYVDHCDMKSVCTPQHAQPIVG